ncbi:hypothetical protein [uncultured Sphingomonas sp.]|uniref:hypothetical protein n=1 Tax=uncultured Sphingomonas sp. TaxID=158754 RepID=UPI00374814BF
MPSSDAMSYSNAPPGTIISSRAIQAGAEARFERWVDQLQDAARDSAGYLGAIQLRQTQGLQHIVFRFERETDARAWRESDRFRALAAAANDFSTGLDQMQAGDPVRFEAPNDNAAVGWKRFIATWIAVFPVLLAISSVMRWLLAGLPPALQLLPSSLVLTAVLQWIVLPRLQRWSRVWLLQDGDGKLRTN